MEDKRLEEAVHCLQNMLDMYRTITFVEGSREERQMLLYICRVAGLVADVRPITMVPVTEEGTAP